MNQPQMSVDFLKANYPDVASALFDEGRYQAIAEARSTGAAMERARLQSLNALRGPGTEAMVDAAIADGKTTAQDIAMKIIARQKAQLEIPRRIKETEALAAKRGIDFAAAWTTLYGTSMAIPGAEPEGVADLAADLLAKQRKADQAEALARREGIDFTAAYIRLFGTALA